MFLKFFLICLKVFKDFLWICLKVFKGFLNFFGFV